VNNKLLWAVSLVLVVLFQAAEPADARNIQHEIDSVHQERMRLVQVRKALERQLGDLGREMQKLDAALILARNDLRKVTKQWQETDKKVRTLTRQQHMLQRQLQRLQTQMQQEANAAWKRAKRQPSWLDMLAGVPITEVPHRQFMMRYMLEKQQQERLQWQETLLALKQVEEKLLAERKVLAKLRDEKQTLKQQAAQRLKLKQQKARALRRDVALKKKRDAGLKQQEKALKQLLNGLQDALLASDKVVKHVSIRKRKGRLSWPLKGTLVEKFGSRLDKQHHKLLGVQIAPASLRLKGKAVHAMAAGQVRYADWFGGFGLMMIIEYGDGMMGIYAHNDALHKQLGDWVEVGEVVAEAGSTGWVEKTRLYFELRDKGKAVNPARWCR